MTAPQRLQLFTSPDFNLETVSRLANGLPGRRICGPTNFASPYHGKGSTALKRDLYRDMLRNPESRRGQWVHEHVHELAGHNLFCICRAGVPCHGDVLIEMANAHGGK
jgi:hypothetical protein